MKNSTELVWWRWTKLSKSIRIGLCRPLLLFEGVCAEKEHCLMFLQEKNR